MQWRLLQEDEKEYFNAFIAAAPKGHILQTWEWGEVKAISTWQALRLVIEEDEKIIGACSLLKRSLPLGMGCLFYAPRGPVLDIDNQEIWDMLWQAVRTIAKEHRAIFCKIDPDIASNDLAWQQALNKTGFISAEKGEGFDGIQPRHVFRLDIRPTEEELLAAMHQKTRYNIRLAVKKGVTVEIKGKEELPVFYKLLTETATRDKFLVRSYDYFQTFYDKLVPAGLAQLFLTYYEGKAIAGALTFKLGEKAWYIYGASANQYRNVMPNYLMQWEMIKWAKNNDCTLYDFRGVPGNVPEDHPLYGLVKFKKGFGGDYIHFIGEYDLIFRPATYKFYNWLEPLYQKWVRRLIRFKKKIKKSLGK